MFRYLRWEWFVVTTLPPSRSLDNQNLWWREAIYGNVEPVQCMVEYIVLDFRSRVRWFVSRQRGVVSLIKTLYPLLISTFNLMKTGLIPDMTEKLWLWDIIPNPNWCRFVNLQKLWVTKSWCTLMIESDQVLLESITRWDSIHDSWANVWKFGK